MESSATAALAATFILLIGMLIVLNLIAARKARQAAAASQLRSISDTNAAIKKLETETIRGSQEYKEKLEAYREKYKNTGRNVIAFPKPPADGGPSSAS